MTPRYPIYVPSKGRFKNCLTAKLLIKDEVPFKLVVEEQEVNEYRSRFGDEHILVLPFRDKGSVIPARNWIKQHATDSGADRHWQLDDNIRVCYRHFRGKRIACNIGIGLQVVEDFTDRYTNIAISGMNYRMFIPEGGYNHKPFFLNCRVYSCCLILNSIPFQWRGRYNEDTDLCLQVLSKGWCTVLVNAFIVDKIRTMNLKGGNTTELYQGDGRLKMARSLERLWPGVVETKRRFKRSQHVVKDAWRRFDNPLQLKDEIDLSALPAIDEYGMQLKQVTNDIQSAELRKLHSDYVDKFGSDSDSVDHL